MFSRRIWFILAFMVIPFLACSPGASPKAPEAKRAPDALIAPIEKADWEIAWENTIKEARKEGKVVIYTSAGSTLRAAMQKGFKDRYGVDTEFLSGRGEELTAKLRAERSAGLYLVDLFIGGSTIPLMLMKPYDVLDRAARLFVNWLLGKEGQTIFIQAYGVPSARLDVPTTGLDSLLMLKPEVKYVMGDDEEFLLAHVKDFETSKEIFGIKR